jgi:hypothetical protein
MSTYRLHYFPESGNSYKLALMLTLCGQTFEPVWTDFGGGITRTPEWRRAVNEMGEIPVLEEDGARLTQTAPILLKLAEQYGRFGGENSEQQFQVLRWLFWDNHKLTGYMATYRYIRTFTPSPTLRCWLTSANASTTSLGSWNSTCGDARSPSGPADGGRLFNDRLFVVSTTKPDMISRSVTRPSTPGSCASQVCLDDGHPTIYCPASVSRTTRKLACIGLCSSCGSAPSRRRRGR